MSRDRARSRDRTGEPSGTGDGVRSSSLDHSDPLEQEFDAGVEGIQSGAGEPKARSSEDERGGLRDRVGQRAKQLFSPRAFLVALLLTVVGLLVANASVPLPGAGLLGVFVASFLVGVLLEERRYAETAAAGGLAGGGSVLLDFAVVAVLGGFGPSLAALGAAVGAAVAAVGTYFGRDLRAGLTRDLENRP